MFVLCFTVKTMEQARTVRQRNNGKCTKTDQEKDFRKKNPSGVWLSVSDLSVVLSGR